jgi:hypothetical protein
METLRATGKVPTGVVVYPSNNGRLKSLVLYKDLGGKIGYQWGKPYAKQKGSAVWIYPVALDSGGKTQVAGPKGLGKTSSPARVSDPDTGKEIGTFVWEEVKLLDGSQRARPDSTGEFQVIANKFKQIYGASTLGFANVHDDVDDTSGCEKETRENFFDMLCEIKSSNLDYFVYAGHGNAKSLGSAQVRKDDVGTFCEHLRRLLKPDGVVIFYACLTGKVGGFASMVSREIQTATVWGHSDSGQASRNADKVIYKAGKGTRIQDLLSPAAKANYAAYLIASADFYARMPFLTIDEMNREVEGAGRK